MEYRIQYAPVFTVVEFSLDENEEVIAQPDSMISMTAGIRISASVGQPGAGKKWWSGVKSMLGGESFFRAVFSAKRDGQTVLLAPASYGEIVPIDVAVSGNMFLARGAFLAHTGDCRVDVKYGGLKGMMAKTGLFLLHVSGGGTLFCQTYGSIVERTLQPDEQFLVDNRHVVAFSETVKYELVKSSTNIRDSMMSGEGFINRYTGPGKVLYQTRAKPSVGFLGYIFNAMT